MLPLALGCFAFWRNLLLEELMKKVYLSDNWQLYGEKTGWLSAKVPGCVHIDLLAKGCLEDCFWRDNSKLSQWIEEKDWTYRCEFDAQITSKTMLVFEGLDTYADIYLNGRMVGKTDNMFHKYEFDVSEWIREKNNALEVKFLSPIKAVANKPLADAAFTAERLNTRRIQCTYGWDWVDRFVTCGIYRPVYIRYEDDMYADNVYVCTENIDSHSAQIYTEIEFKNFEIGSLVKLEIFSPMGTRIDECEFYVNQSIVSRRFDISEPELWYPSGYGEQPLYSIKVTVGNNVLTQNFGVRTLKIVQLRDVEGSDYYKKSKSLQSTEIGKLYSNEENTRGFQVVVNSQKIFCKGGNWVPCEPFPSEESDEKYRLILSQAKEMNLNMVRIWGGGLFEKTSFYDECDRLGILVVHDFMMACGHYPEKEEWFINALKNESLYAVKLLRTHPCIAWWHGDNENAMKGSDIMTDYTGRDTAFLGIAPQIRELDRIRPFLPSSPYGGDLYASLTSGTAHISNYCGEIFDYFTFDDCKNYKEFFEQFSARFISEEPTLGAVNMASMLRFMTMDDIVNDDSEEILRFHTKTNPALDRHLFDDIKTFTEKVLGSFTDGKDRYFKYKYIQYEWVRIVFELCRRDLGYSNGMVFWMLNDCWPAALGWSLIDYYGFPKAAFYSVKRCAKHIVSSVTEENGKYKVTLSNDGLTPANITAKAYLLDRSNECSVITEYNFTCDVDSYSVKDILLPWSAEDDKLVICDIETDCETDRSFYTKGNLPLIKSQNAFEVLKTDENGVCIRANKYIHTLEIEGQYVCDDNYFSMMAGEEKCIKFVRKATDLSMETEITAYTLGKC